VREFPARSYCGRRCRRSPALKAKKSPACGAWEEELSSVSRTSFAGVALDDRCRLHWREAGAKLSGKQNFAAFDFPKGALLLTEAGTRKRASLHLLEGEEALPELDRGGLGGARFNRWRHFSLALTRENHTLKRALTDPRLFSGIGNAYSDEILHAARLSPVTLTQKLSSQDIGKYALRYAGNASPMDFAPAPATGDEFPENVTAFRPEMAVHGKFLRPCPVCGAKVQRIRYADNETNYSVCQTGRQDAGRPFAVTAF